MENQPDIPREIDSMRTHALDLLSRDIMIQKLEQELRWADHCLKKIGTYLDKPRKTHIEYAEAVGSVQGVINHYRSLK